jgi:uncharacterized damage-inducible protein DinB
MKILLLSLIDHMRWADALFADALEQNPPNDPDALRLFSHVASVEHLWYVRIFEQPPKHAVWPAFTVPEARAIAAAHADLFTQLVRDGSDADLARKIHYRNSAGRDYQSTVGDIVTHVAAHGTHHRGQIARVIRAFGQVPPYTDYIQFTRRDQ